MLLSAGFTCRWQLTPDQPDVLLSIDYRGLLPDESIVLELAPNNIIRLRAPEGPGAVFQASVWVERSILVSFQTTRLSTDRGGGWVVSYTAWLRLQQAKCLVGQHATTDATICGQQQHLEKVENVSA